MARLCNILSLFDGISCGRLALDRASIKYEKYYASEVNKYAIAIARYNYPDTIFVGDIIREARAQKPQFSVKTSKRIVVKQPKQKKIKTKKGS